MIRPSVISDAEQVAPLFLLGMGHIAGIFANSERHEDAIPFFEHFFTEPDNQYSYQNTVVFENDRKIIGSITGYDGALLKQLREPILNEIRKTTPDFLPNDETEAGEFYLDCLNVHPDHQGKGIGKQLILAFCNLGAKLGHCHVGLIVDQENPTARQIYERLGFITIGTRDFMEHTYFHMIKEL
jgi:ribosomal protein S18 acetylase RimI-like enzyme